MNLWEGDTGECRFYVCCQLGWQEITVLLRDPLGPSDAWFLRFKDLAGGFLHLNTGV